MVTQEIGIHALIRTPRHHLDVDIGGPRLITVSRGLGEIESEEKVSTRGKAALFLYHRDKDQPGELWLVAAFHPTETLAGNEAEEAVREAEEETNYRLDALGVVPYGILYSAGGKLSMLSIDLSREFMEDAVMPHDLLLPKRVPAALRINEYWQLWISL